ENHGQHGKNREAPEHNREGTVREEIRLFASFVFERGRIKRHERNAEGAFSRDAAEEIRKAQRNKERIGHRPGAEDNGGKGVTSETCYPRDGSHAGDGGHGFYEFHVLSNITPLKEKIGRISYD